MLGICYILCMCVWRGGAHVNAAAQRSQKHLHGNGPEALFFIRNGRHVVYDVSAVSKIFGLFIEFVAIYSCLLLFLEFV